MNTHESKPIRSLTTPNIDFMLLGGASLYVWMIMVSIGLFYQGQANEKFFYFAVMFNWLAIFCNFPHFLVSYRFGYGRGKDFILKNWAALILVPVVLIILFAIAFAFFQDPVQQRFGTIPNMGNELLSLSVRLMFVTSAWHYAKQAFGCIMVFSHYADYPLSRSQRTLWKMSLFSVGFYNFFYISNLMSGLSGPFTDFQGVRISNITFPLEFTYFSLALVVLLILAVLYFIIYKNYKTHQKLPTSRILIPWIALHFWWIPFLSFHDFYFLAVPFFHSLQYLLFAWQLEKPAGEKMNMSTLGIMIAKAFALLLAGYLSFIYVPEYLDSAFRTNRDFHVVFFLVAIPVFINIHHFFIDSVVWRFKDEEVRKKLLD